LLLRVKGTSLAALRDLGAFAKARRTSYFNLLTRIGFDYTKAYPKLTFTGLGYLDQESADEVAALRETSTVDEICGVTESAPPVYDDLPVVSAADVEAFETPKAEAKPKPKAEAKPKAEKPASKAKAALDDMVSDLAETKPAPVKVEEKVVEMDIDDDDFMAKLDSLDLDD
jgi:hypothetical protein